MSSASIPPSSHPARTDAGAGSSWEPDVAEAQPDRAAHILLVPNGSPYHRAKHAERIGIMLGSLLSGVAGYLVLRLSCRLTDSTCR